MFLRIAATRVYVLPLTFPILPTVRLNDGARVRLLSARLPSSDSALAIVIRADKARSIREVNRSLTTNNGRLGRLHSSALSALSTGRAPQQRELHRLAKTYLHVVGEFASTGVMHSLIAIINRRASERRRRREVVQIMTEMSRRAELFVFACVVVRACARSIRSFSPSLSFNRQIRLETLHGGISAQQLCTRQQTKV